MLFTRVVAALHATICGSAIHASIGQPPCETLARRFVGALKDGALSVVDEPARDEAFRVLLGSRSYRALAEQLRPTEVPA